MAMRVDEKYLHKMISLRTPRSVNVLPKGRSLGVLLGGYWRVLSPYSTRIHMSAT